MPKTMTNVYISYELKENAKSKGINLSKTLEEALEAKIGEKREPEEIKKEKEAELVHLKQKQGVVEDYLRQMQSKQVEMSKEEKVALLEAKRRKTLSELRDKYFDQDRELYNISYQQLKREGKVPKGEMNRYKAINARYRQNFKNLSGKLP